MQITNTVRFVSGRYAGKLFYQYRQVGGIKYYNFEGERLPLVDGDYYDCPNFTDIKTRIPLGMMEQCEHTYEDSTSLVNVLISYENAIDNILYKNGHQMDVENAIKHIQILLREALQVSSEIIERESGKVVKDDLALKLANLVRNL